MINIKEKIKIKGEYIEIIDRKGKRHRYKYDGKIPIDIYLLAVRNGVKPNQYIKTVKNKEPRSHIRKGLIKYMAKNKRYQKIETIFRKAKSTIRQIAINYILQAIKKEEGDNNEDKTQNTNKTYIQRREKEIKGVLDE